MCGMLIDVRDILKASGLSKAVELELTASGCGVTEFEKECVFDEPVYVSAELANIKGMIRVKGVVKASYSAVCARCLKPVRVEINKAFDDEYAPLGSLGEVSAEDAEVYEYSDKEVDIGIAVRFAILLEIPIRHLCSAECKSLCPKCGKDLNEGACGCSEQDWDTRFAVLQNLKA